MSEDAVFRALADGTRRSVLDSLHAHPGQTLAALAAQFPTMTRFGVMKHLTVLADANLVVAHRDGRTKRHYLNPVPIHEIANRWTSKFSTPIANALLGLRAEIERPPTAGGGART